MEIEESTLDNDIDAFFKAQSDQDMEIAGISEEECPAEIPLLDDNYISKGDFNIAQIISTLDQPSVAASVSQDLPLQKQTKLMESGNDTFGTPDSKPSATTQQPLSIDQLLQKHFQISAQLGEHPATTRASTDATGGYKKQRNHAQAKEKRPYSLGSSFHVSSDVPPKLVPFSLPPLAALNELKEGTLSDAPAEVKRFPETVEHVHDISALQLNTPPETREDCEYDITVASEREEEVFVEQMPRLGESRTVSSEAKASSSSHHEPLKPAETPAISNPIVFEHKSKSAPSASEANALTLSIKDAVESLRQKPFSDTKHEADLKPSAIVSTDSMATLTDGSDLSAMADALAIDVGEDEDETLELMFDAETNSYYDPKTGKYYEIEESDDEGEQIIS
ncbi:hypothetical protein HDU98_007262 [Podochytrium sp. JEL0797]|nr:hypothetical protein HDU98_007262 [Podochytrium sp. JEL0797]